METVGQTQAQIAVDLRLRGAAKVREMRETMACVTQHMPWWFRLKRALGREYSPSLESCIALFAAEEIIILRSKLADLEAKLKALGVENP